MAKDFDHTAIEKKWREQWEKDRVFETPDSVQGKDNLYTLVEFPYPSGDLHIGHWYAYAVPDIFARMKRMQGKNVLYPMGFDEFGLPAENAAMKRNINPADWIDESVAKMRAQLKTIGASFDWSREVRTSLPEYMKWTQWLFLKLYEKGLAYRAKSPVNWCPVDQTVLANEQVIDGKCERCGSEVVQKELEQWFFKITDYAERLLSDLEPLDWPEAIKESQRNWIGKSDGAEIDFDLDIPTNVKRFVILHGRKSSGDGQFIPWLKRELESRGYEVENPTLPNADNPSDEEQADYAEKHCTFDESTAVIGHSFGGVVALRLLERGHKVARTTLVGTPYLGKYLDGKERPTVTRAVMRGFDANTIKKNAGGIVLLYDINDHVIPVSDGEAFEKLLGGYLIRGKGMRPHFTGSIEPDVRMAALPTIRVFTTRADTLFGATFLVLAPEHPWVTRALQDDHNVLSNKKEVKKYVEEAKKKSQLARQTQKEKTGVKLEGVTAVNPGSKEKIPVYVAGYVLGGYGTGAIMAVPAHDERDGEFAKKFGISVKEVIAENGTLKNSGAFNGADAESVKGKIAESVGGRITTTYKFRDWLISRQRYWGAAIPIVYDPDGNAHPIPEEHLPWLLPKDADIKPKGTSPLGTSKELLARTENIFGKGWRPETDTMDGFVDNSWYFLRYLDPKNDKEFSSLDKQNKWMPIVRYSGGAEHTTVHVLYSRFLYKALFDMGLTTHAEPYLSRLNRGIILAEDGRKMSKRWGNTINPDEEVARVGADAVRTYLAFIGPYNEVGSFPWSTNGLIGVRRFLERVADLPGKASDVPVPSELETLLHQSVKKVGEDIESMKFNTSVSQLMILSNELLKLQTVPRKAVETLLVLLAPFAPHLAEELWQELGKTGSIHKESWPSYDPKKLRSSTVTVAVQIAGKTRGTIEVPGDASESDVLKALRNDPKIAPHVPDLPRRVVYVTGRVINLIP